MENRALSQQMKHEVADLMPRFLQDEFVKGIAAGHLPQAGLINYTQQDNLYLESFRQLYQVVLGQLDPALLAATEQDLKAENTAHQVLLRVAKTDNQTIMAAKPKQQLVTRQYLTHMRQAVEQSATVGLASMQACLYVYNYLANELVQQGKNQAHNPFKAWIDFYAGSEASLVDTMFQLLDQKVNSQDYTAAIQTFRTSVIDELEFFAQAWEVKYY